MSDLFITCENLVKIYKVANIEVVALQGLDLYVDRGEILGIVGSSGSGKSTLLNVLGGLDRPSAGKVRVDQLDLLKASDVELDRYRRERVGFVWQQTGRNLIPYLSAQQNVELPMTIAGIVGGARREWSETLMESLGMLDFRNNTLEQLSGGQQQRVAIATALANKPDLLLADEPTGELDSVTAKDVLDLLRQVNERFGTTVIIVTHDPSTARFVDRVITIRDGRTSSESIRRVADVEAALVGASAPEKHHFDELLVVDQSGRLQIPSELLVEAGIADRVRVEQTEDGLLIRPVLGRTSRPVVTVDEPESPLTPRRTSLLRRLRARIRGASDAGSANGEPGI